MGFCLNTAGPVVKKDGAERQIPPSRLRSGSPGAIILNEHPIDLTRDVT
jgi:hypothetical protein